MAKVRSNRVVRMPAGGGLPSYTLRRSTRAKRVQLRYTAHEGLVVVVPASMPDFDPSEALRQRRDWIESATAEYAERRKRLTADPASLLPTEVVFSATAEHWPVVYRTTSARATSARFERGEIVVRGPDADMHARLRALRRWLQREASVRLLPMLESESFRTGITPTRVGIRGQRARWGGCSATGSITLNRCLLFLPQELVRAVVLHELAHVSHPNHSAAFWAVLLRLDPEAHAHDASIRDARDSIPPWAEPGAGAQ